MRTGSRLGLARTCACLRARRTRRDNGATHASSCHLPVFSRGVASCPTAWRQVRGAFLERASWRIWCTVAGRTWGHDLFRGRSALQTLRRRRAVPGGVWGPYYLGHWCVWCTAPSAARGLCHWFNLSRRREGRGRCNIRGEHVAAGLNSNPPCSASLRLCFHHLPSLWEVGNLHAHRAGQASDNRFALCPEGRTLRGRTSIHGRSTPPPMSLGHWANFFLGHHQRLSSLANQVGRISLSIHGNEDGEKRGS